MTADAAFIDYYSVLEIDRGCDGKTLEAAYRRLAKMYHPDHPETADVDKFNEVIDAYRVLRHVDQRADYDRSHAAHNGDTYAPFTSPDAPEIEEKDALDDADAHARILMMLYKRRRENAQDAGVIGYFVQQMLGCSDERFDFLRWYLKAKGYLEVTEQGTLAITIAGVDHVIATSRTTRVEKLLLESSRQEDAGR